MSEQKKIYSFGTKEIPLLNSEGKEVMKDGVIEMTTVPSLEFTLKNLRIAGVRKSALKLIAKYRKVITESNDPLDGLIEMFYPDVEMPLIENGVIQKDADGKDLTVIEVQPQFKYIFESILDGELDKIDYDNLIECEKLGRECLFDFFMQSKGLLGV